MGVKIFVHKDESIDRAIRRFKTACEKAGIKKTFKEKARYEKPSDTRRKEERKRLRAIQKATFLSNKSRDRERDPDAKEKKEERSKY